MTDQTITAFPLTWPDGWRRAKSRKSDSFGSKRYSGRIQPLNAADASRRVYTVLDKLGALEGSIVISCNVRVRLDGYHRNDIVPDPGVAVYWKEKRSRRARCIAIDTYYTVAGNLAAVAATLEALRAVERHGGAEILDRAFTGFGALPAPEQWWQVLGVRHDATVPEIRAAWQRLAAEHHPDKGGTDQAMARINAARDEGMASRA